MQSSQWIASAGRAGSRRYICDDDSGGCSDHDDYNGD